MSAFTPIHISLSPNTEPDDIRLAAQVLLAPHRWQSFETERPGILKTLSQRLGDRSVVLTSSGRTALYEALRAANIGDGDEVILQAFTCLAVPAAVTWAGATPVYADIDAGTYNLNVASVKACITPHTKAIIIQHTFGIPAPLPELLALAREHKLVVIEDLAHSLGGTFENKPLGTFGDIAILSFGRDKTISSVFGGAVVTRDQTIHDTLQKNMATYRMPPVSWVVQQLLHPLVTNMALSWYFTGHLGKILLVAAQRVHLTSMAVSAQEKLTGAAPAYLNYQLHPALLPLLKQQLDKLDRFTAHRRRIAERYVSAFPGSPYPDRVASESNWLRFPLAVTNKLAVLAAAKQQGIILGDWYATPVAPTALSQSAITRYIPGSCPVAEHAAEQVINLPTHPRLTDSDVEHVIQFVKKQSL